MKGAISASRPKLGPADRSGIALPFACIVAGTSLFLVACDAAKAPAPEANADAASQVSSTATGDLAGTYRIDLADGTVLLQTLRADGTYVETTPEGAQTGAGSWRVGDRGTMCFDPEGDEGEECYAGGAPGADGAFELRDANGNVRASVSRAEADAPEPVEPLPDDATDGPAG